MTTKYSAHLPSCASKASLQRSPPLKPTGGYDLGDRFQKDRVALNPAPLGPIYGTMAVCFS